MDPNLGSQTWICVILDYCAFVSWSKGRGETSVLQRAGRRLFEHKQCPRSEEFIARRLVGTTN